MAERSSELEDLNDFGNSDRAADANAAERVAEEIGITAENGAATAYSTETLSDTAIDDDDATRLAARDTNSRVATTAGATATTMTVGDDDDDDLVDDTALTTTDTTATANVAPADAIVDPAAEPEEIKASIENTRSEMSETINAIQDKLSISNITAQVKEEVTGQISGAYETVKHALFGATLGKAGGFFGKMSKTTNEFLEDYGPAISQAGTTVVRSAKSNPIPFALIGLGVGMLLLGGGKKKTRKVKSYRRVSDRNRSEDLDYDNYQSGGSTTRSYYSTDSSSTDSSLTGSGATARSYTGGTTEQTGGSSSGSNRESTASKAYNRVGSAASSAASSVSGAASSAASSVSSAASSAASTVSNAASSALSGVSSAASSVGSGTKQAARFAADQIEENPIAISGIAFALGTVVGLAIPSTDTENALLGEYRENLVQKAQEAAGGVIEKVQQVAGEVGKTVQEEAKAQGLTQQ